MRQDSRSRQALGDRVSLARDQSSLISDPVSLGAGDLGGEGPLAYLFDIVVESGCSAGIGIGRTVGHGDLQTRGLQAWRNDPVTRDLLQRYYGSGEIGAASAHAPEGLMMIPIRAVFGAAVLLGLCSLTPTPVRADDVIDRLDRIEGYLEIESAQHAFELAIEHDRLQRQQRIPANLPKQVPAWQPAPGAQPIFACGIAKCSPFEQSFADAEWRRVNHQPPLAPTIATQRFVGAQLDSAPDLAGRWRQINEDPQFIAWLDTTKDPSTGWDRGVLLRHVYAAGDAERTAALFRAYIAEHVAMGVGHAYTYVPTEQDREEIRACVNAARPNTSAVDCVMPTANRITSTMMKEIDRPGWPAHPSQMTVMLQSAGLKCGMPADNPSAPVPPSAKPCLDVEARKAALAVVLGLRDFLKAISR